MAQPIPTPTAIEAQRRTVLSTLLDAMHRMDDRSAEMAGLRADLQDALGLHDLHGTDAILPLATASA